MSRPQSIPSFWYPQESNPYSTDMGKPTPLKLGGIAKSDPFHYISKVGQMKPEDIMMDLHPCIPIVRYRLKTNPKALNIHHDFG